MWPFKKRYPPRTELEVEDRWSVSQGEHDGRPLIVRLNHGVRKAVGHPEFRHQVGVAVPLDAPDENGFPTPEESAQLDRLEDLLEVRLEADRQCLHVATLSTGGMREFLFYSADPIATRAALEQLAAEVSTYEVQFIVQDDPKWNVYRQFT